MFRGALNRLNSFECTDDVFLHFEQSRGTVVAPQDPRSAVSSYRSNTTRWTLLVTNSADCMGPMDSTDPNMEIQRSEVILMAPSTDFRPLLHSKHTPLPQNNPLVGGCHEYVFAQTCGTLLYYIFEVDASGLSSVISELRRCQVPTGFQDPVLSASCLQSRFDPGCGDMETLRLGYSGDKNDRQYNSGNRSMHLARFKLKLQ